MKVKMLTLDAGPDGVRKPGEIHDVAPEEAKALIDGGYAVKVEKTTAVQPPVKNKPRTATRRAGRTATKSDAETDSAETGSEEDATD